MIGRVKKLLKKGISLLVSVVLLASPLSSLVYAGSALDTWQASNVFELTENGTYTVYAIDGAGNVSDGYTVVINNVDTMAPTVTLSFSTTDFISGDVTMTITATDNVDEGGVLDTSLDYEILDSSNGVLSNSSSYTFTSNESGVVNVWDDAGNLTSVVYAVTNIDKTAPVITLTPDVTEPTSGDVTVVASATDNLVGLDALPYSFDGGAWSTTDTWVFTSNGTHSIRCRDSLGNISEETLVVSNIDKVNPSVDNIVPSTTDPINTYVDLTVLASDVGLGLNANAYKIDSGDWVSTNVFRVTANGTYTLTVRDMAGNEDSDTIVVSNLDYVAPTINSVVPSTVDQTNQDVILTIDAVDDSGGLGLSATPYMLMGIGTWQASNKLSVEVNGSYTVRVVDVAGNIAEYSLSISNIDKVLPNTSSVLDISTPTNTDVDITLTASDDIEIATVELPDGTIINGSSFLGDTIYTVTTNGSYAFIVTDTAGNITTEIVTVANIDKDAPVISLITFSAVDPVNTYIDATVTAYDIGLGLSDTPYNFTGSWGASNVERYTTNGIYNVSVADLAGNITNQSFTIANLDFDAPVIDSIDADITVQTNTDVVLTVTAHDVGLGLETSAYSIDGGAYQTSPSFTVTENGTYTFTVIDDAGNTVTQTFTVANIDKDVPTGTITPSNTLPTSSDVQLDFVFSDNVGVVDLIMPDATIISGPVGTYSYTATVNGTYDFIISDAAGNVTIVSYTVSNIDKVPATITYSDPSGSWTASNFTLKVIFKDDTKVVGITDSDGTYYDIDTDTLPTNFTVIDDKTVTIDVAIKDNISLDYSVVDFGGTTVSDTYVVDNLDRVAPSITVSASEDLTNEDVTITVKGSDSFGEVDYITTPDGKVSGNLATYPAPTNGTYTFKVTDKAGNTVTDSITISSIDKDVPTVTLPDFNSINSKYTSSNVSLTFLAEDTNGIASYTLVGSGYSETNSSGVFTVTSNGTYTIYITDMVGNEFSYVFTVSCIDKVSPSISLSMLNSTWINDENWIVVDASDALSGLNATAFKLDDGSWQASNQLHVTSGGTYTIYVRDAVDNVTSVTYTAEYVAPVVSDSEDSSSSTSLLDDDTATAMNQAITELTSEDNESQVEVEVQESMVLGSILEPEVIIDIVKGVADAVVVNSPWLALALFITILLIIAFSLTGGVRVYSDINGVRKYLGIARCVKRAEGYEVKVGRTIFTRTGGTDYLLKFGSRYAKLNKNSSLAIRVGDTIVKTNLFKLVEFSSVDAI